MKRTIAVLAALSSASLMASQALASGFELRQHSATGLGQAFSGATAGGADLSGMFFNPAAAALHGEGTAASLSYLWIHSDVTRAEGTTAAGTPTGGGTGGDPIPDAIVPAVYGSKAVTEDVFVGLAVNVPWGLKTDYDAGWEGRYHALETEIRTVNVNPVLAWRSDWVHLAAGLQIQYADGTLSNAIDYGSIGAGEGVPGAAPGEMDGSVSVDGDDWAAGFTLGAIFTPWDGGRLGLAYRSKISHDLSGRANFRDDDAGVAEALRAATGSFADTTFTAGLTTPERISAGFQQDLRPEWSVAGEVQWTRWSRFDTFRVRFDNPAQPDDVTRNAWRDSWFLALGTQWRPNETWTLRAGAAHDFSPVRTATRTPRIPDADRTWIALGAGYSPNDWLELDFGWTHLFMSTARIDQRGDTPENAGSARGSLDAAVDTNIDIFALQGRIVF